MAEYVKQESSRWQHYATETYQHAKLDLRPKTALHWLNNKLAK